MKRKIFIVLVAIALLVPSVAFAQMFDISLGATAQYQLLAGETTGDIQAGNWNKFGDINNWKFGADFRLKLTIVELDVVGTYSQSNASGSTIHEISGLVTGGLSFDLFNVVRIGVGMGPRMLVLIDGNGHTVVYDGNGNAIAGDFQESFMQSPMAYRATVDFMLGPLMLGMNYTVDSTFTFGNPDPAKLVPDWEAGKLGVSVLFSFF